MGGAGWTEPVSSLVDYWAGFNNCSLTPQIENMPDINAGDGSTVEKFSYLNGDNCTEVIHYKITNGDHTWPGTAFDSPGMNYDIDASVEVWNFLSQYDINGLINCVNVGISEKPMTPSITLYPNPVKNILNIEGLHSLIGLKQLVISDLSGATVLITDSAKNGIDISELSSGFYFIHIKHSTVENSIKFTKGE